MAAPSPVLVALLIGLAKFSEYPRTRVPRPRQTSTIFIRRARKEALGDHSRPERQYIACSGFRYRFARKFGVGRHIGRYRDRLLQPNLTLRVLNANEKGPETGTALSKPALDKSCWCFLSRWSQVFHNWNFDQLHHPVSSVAWRFARSSIDSDSKLQPLADEGRLLRWLYNCEKMACPTY
jgi:hypothetical protein